MEPDTGMAPDIELPSDAYLEVTRKGGEVFRFPIAKKTVTVGRDPGCDLHLNDPYVSRKHCQIVFRGDHFTVMDLGSLNKTVVKGKEFIQRNLMPGTLINLGETQLRFFWDSHLAWRREHGFVEEEPPEDEPPQEQPPEDEPRPDTPPRE